jgi:hypothetical protein
MDLTINFSNEAQRAFYYATARNQCNSGGFNSGKTFGACLKIFTLLTTFPGYRVLIGRQVRADLMKTTYQTFFKICPQELIERNNEQDGLTVLKNGSRVIWLHLDKVEESTLRGIESNSIYIDQPEEVEEKVIDILDARLGRWDNVEVPKELLDANPEWPVNTLTGKYVVPSYFMLTPNPDTQYHWIYRKYHPESLTRNSLYFFVESQWDPKLGSVESYQNALNHDEEWVAKYIKGQWGISNAQIHRVWGNSFLEASPELLDRIKRKGNLYRILDHGESSPTCNLWFAAIGGVYICFREYYVPNKVVSEHRQAINDLSGDESYTGNFADPSIFYKESKKNAGFWSIADEYMSKDIDLKSKPIAWIPADNNEFATRNRINELLRPRDYFRHPLTNESPAPGIYFIKKSTDYPYGCFHSINEIGSQRRKLLGYEEGKAIYSDDREETIKDHAYDCVRYFVAMHGSARAEVKPKIPRNSIAFYKMKMRAKKMVSSLSAA